MSWWIQKKGRDGKQYLWAIDIDPMATFILLALVFALAGPAVMQDPVSSIAIFSVIVIAVGLICLTISKFSLYRQGIWRSWGTRLMSKGNARLYLVGYALIFIGSLALIKLATTKG